MILLFCPNWVGSTDRELESVDRRWQEVKKEDEGDKNEQRKKKKWRRCVYLPRGTSPSTAGCLQPGSSSTCRSEPPAAGLWEPGRWARTEPAAHTHTQTHTSTHTNTHRLKHSSQTTHWLHIWTHVLCFTAPLWAAGRWSLSGTAARSPASCASPGWSRTCQSARPEPIASRDRSTSKGGRRTGSEGRVFSELTCLWLYVFLCSSQKLF